MRLPQDVVSLSDLKVNPGRVVMRVAREHRRVLLTNRGRGVAVMQSVADYEAAEEERAFTRAVVAGFYDLEAGRDLTLDDARTRLGA